MTTLRIHKYTFWCFYRWLPSLIEDEAAAIQVHYFALLALRELDLSIQASNRLELLRRSADGAIFNFSSIASC